MTNTAEKEPIIIDEQPDEQPPAYTLRPYQEECKQAIEEAGEGNHLVVLATGMGKTMVFTHLEDMGRTLILSHRDELVRQPEKYYKGRRTFGVEKAEEHASDEEIVSASVQSLQQDSRLNQYDPNAFETIIIDEAHHAAAKTYRKILKYFTGAKRKIGFTATPNRGDGVGLDKVFDKIIFSRDLRWGIQNNYLTPIRCERVSGGYKLVNVPKQNGDYSASQVTLQMEGSDTIQIAAKAYIEKCHNRGKHTLIYCASKKLCFLVQGIIQQMLPKEEAKTICVITGDTPDEERAKILDDFQKGEVKSIVNCMILTEGTDLPICDAIINLRPTCNSGLYQQMVGRGTRLHDGKEYCLVLDVLPEDADRKYDLCTAPSLFGINAAMLDKTYQRALTEDTDLMELCNSFSAAFATAAQRLQLAYHSVNLFMEEVEELKEKSNTLEEFARNYSNSVDEKNNVETDYDFGSLSVQIQADESRYYKINPTWHERVFLSKPDALDMTTITIELGDDSDADRYQGQMKMQEAINMVKTYCETKPDYCRYAWDKNLQENWKKAEASEAQMKRIYRDVAKLDIPYDQGPANLTKLEAFRLIDLVDEIKNAKEKTKIFELATSDGQSKKVQEAKDKAAKLTAVQGDSPKQRKEMEKKFQDFQKKLERTLQSIDMQKERMRIRQEGFVKQQKSIMIYLTSLLRSNEPASEKQMNYIQSLYEKAIRLGSQFDEKPPKQCTMRQASMCIEFLKRITSEPFYHGFNYGNPWAECMKVEEHISHVCCFQVTLP